MFTVLIRTSKARYMLLAYAELIDIRKHSPGDSLAPALPTGSTTDRSRTALRLK